MILFTGFLILLDGIRSLTTRHNTHYPQSPLCCGTGRLTRAVLGVILIIISVILRTNYDIAWAQLCPAKTGTASWYDYQSCRKEGTSGLYTASGRKFNHNALTAASWDHKFGAKLKITNLKNKKSVIVRVNDRGPAKRLHKKGRIIDLSRGAFQRIADLRTGIIKVTVQEL